jgi:hypothetical protein
VKERVDVINLAESSPIQPSCQINKGRVPDDVATFAMEMIRSGMLAGTFGERTLHYQVLTLMPPQEIVQRACDIAEHTFDEFEKRGWMIIVPSREEQIEKLQSDAPSSPGFTRKVA